MAAEDETAARIPVQAVGKGRGVWQAKAQRTEAAFQIGAAAGTGMNGDARRLVDDQDQPVAVEHAVRKKTSDSDLLSHPSTLWRAAAIPLPCASASRVENAGADRTTRLRRRAGTSRAPLRPWAARDGGRLP